MPELTSPAGTAVGSVIRIPTGDIHPGPNIRGSLGDVDELAASLRAIGQQIPVVVELLVDGNRWQLVDGHRRHAAALRAGLPHLDAVVRAAGTDARRALVQLAIAGGARSLDPIAEARTLHRLMFEVGMTREQIAAAVGRSPMWVRDRIALVHLEPDEIRQVERGRLTVGEALLRLAGRRAARDAGTEPAPAAATPARAVGGRVRATPPGSLSDRQLQAVAALADGLEYGDIARRLGVGVATVRTLLSRAYVQLGARNAAHAVHLAHLAGLLPIRDGADA